MTSPKFTEDMTVDEVLRNWPETIPLFVRQTDCVGCSMTSFCTLSDVAKLYEITLDTFLDHLHAAVYKAQATDGNG